MKIALMTIWHCGNYGAEMQAYATMKALRKLGHEVEIIDFRLFEHAHALRSQVAKVLTSLTPVQRNFEKFWKQYIKDKSCHYHNVEELENNPPLADCYLVGSDQVWNEDITKAKSKAYFLDFGLDSMRRISYASSIGVSEWKFSEKFTLLAKKQFNKFYSISCREKTGSQVLAKKFGVEVKTVLDPTLLHTDYHEITGTIEPNNSLVFYPLSPNDTDLIPFCKDLAAALHIPYINANPYVFMPFLPIVWKRNTISQWISAIGGAQLVITGSFHGLAFSLIHHRQFILINSNHQGRNSRMTDLLDYLGLRNRLFTSVEEAKASKVWEEEINYQEVDKKLNEAREQSWNYLKESLL